MREIVRRRRVGGRKHPLPPESRIHANAIGVVTAKGEERRERFLFSSLRKM